MGKKEIKIYHVQVQTPYEACARYIYLKGTNKLMSQKGWVFLFLQSHCKLERDCTEFVDHLGSPDLTGIGIYLCLLSSQQCFVVLNGQVSYCLNILFILMLLQLELVFCSFLFRLSIVSV